MKGISLIPLHIGSTIAFIFSNSTGKTGMCHMRTDWPRAATDKEFSICPDLTEFVTNDCYEFDYPKLARYANKRYLCMFMFSIYSHSKKIQFIYYTKIILRYMPIRCCVRYDCSYSRQLLSY